MGRREFLAILAALPVLQVEPTREARPYGTGPIPYWLFELDQALEHGWYDEAMDAARRMTAAIEDEGIPAPWRPAYRILANHLPKAFIETRASKGGRLCLTTA